MNVAIVHDSEAGNGLKLATTMKEGFEKRGASVTMGKVGELAAASVADPTPDLLIVGAAIRAFTSSPASKRWLSDLSQALQKSGKVIPAAAVFVTHGLPKAKAEGWGKRFRRRVEKIRGVRAVYPDWLSGKVDGQLGPLAEGAEEEFRSHAERLADWVTSGRS